MNEEVLILEGYKSTLYVPSTISELTVKDFINCKSIVGETFTKKKIKRATSTDLQEFGHKRLKDHLDVILSNYSIAEKDRDKYVPVMKLRTTRNDIMGWNRRDENFIHSDSASLQFSLKSIVKNYRSDIYKSINSHNFVIDVERDYNKRRIDRVTNISTFALPHQVKNALLIVNIDSDCFRRFDNVYYDHRIEFCNVFDSYEHIDKSFTNIREMSKYYREFLSELIIKDKHGWIKELKETKIPVIEKELNKDEHWKDSEVEYNGYWEY